MSEHKRDTLRVKICCIQDAEELQIAAACGAHMVGLISQMPSGWGPIEEAAITRLARQTPPGVVSVLLTSALEVETIVDQQRRTGAGALQLVERVGVEVLVQLRAALPGITLLKAVHVTGPDVVPDALALAEVVDGLILDTGSPDAAVKVLGGTGRTHDWSISAEIVDRAACPVFLAGGLKPENVAEAIERVRPFGVDVCTGVRDADRRLDPKRLRAFMRAINGP